MTISAKIIADSVSQEGVRLTTMLLRYPRFIHAELMTHRVFSRNASSSRAIPVERLIKDVQDDPAMPIHWGKNQKGMQADKENDALVFKQYAYTSGSLPGVTPKAAWLQARDEAIVFARAFAEAGYHKQVVNRILEPFAHINVVVTSVHWANFYGLRYHKDAQPEIRALAEAMYNAQLASQPTELGINEWHLPFISGEELSDPHLSIDDLIKMSVARCARTSFLTHDLQIPDPQKDIALHDRLLVERPVHASPAEHQAKPDTRIGAVQWRHPHLHGNLTGWIQYRKKIPNENISQFVFNIE